jgi:hypothetical protein
MRANLLQTFEQLVWQWQGMFSQQRVFARVHRLLFGLLVSLRLHLTSNAICATGRQFHDWSADYRVCSQSPWDPRRLFDPILDALPRFLSEPTSPVLVALDDTLLRKNRAQDTGRDHGSRSDVAAVSCESLLRIAIRASLRAGISGRGWSRAGAPRAL